MGVHKHFDEIRRSKGRLDLMPDVKVWHVTGQEGWGFGAPYYVTLQLRYPWGAGNVRVIDGRVLLLTNIEIKK